MLRRTHFNCSPNTEPGPDITRKGKKKTNEGDSNPVANNFFVGTEVIHAYLHAVCELVLENYLVSGLIGIFDMDNYRIIKYSGTSLSGTLWDLDFSP